jgi:cell shape-determining protein MreC
MNMNICFSIMSARSYFYAFLMTTGAVLAVHSAANAAPTWSTTKVTEGNMGPYCAVSRKIDNTILTVGRTIAGQSSLAVELKGVTLDTSRIYRVGMKPGAAEQVEIETKPLNANTFVLNVDKVVDLSAGFAGSPTLQLKYDDRTLALVLTDWAGASRDLNTCLASLPGGEKMASTPITTGQGRKGSGPTSPTTKAADKVADNTEYTARIGSLLEENRRLREDIMTMRAATSSMTSTNELTSERDQLRVQVQDLQTQLKSIKADHAVGTAMKAADQKAVDDQAARIAALTSENIAMKKQIADAESRALQAQSGIDAAAARVKTAEEKAAAAVASAATAAVSAVATPAMDAEKTALKSERDKLVRENAELQKRLESNISDVISTKKLADEIARLKVEKDTLQAKLDAGAQVGARVAATGGQGNPALQARADMLESENTSLKARITVLENRDKGPDMADLQKRLELLSAENVNLRGQLATAQTSPTDMRVAVAAEAPLRQQLRDMRGTNEQLSAKVSELNKMLDQAQKSNATEFLKGADGKVDVEKTARRLEESQREVQRLSIALRDTKTQCETDKKQIEYMLFDPKLAKEGQIALLNSLEDQIAALRADKGVSPQSIASACLTPATPVGTPVAAPAPSSGPAVTVEPLSSPVATVTNSPMTQDGHFTVPAGANGVASLLKQSGVPVTTPFASVPKNPFGAGKAWRFESGDLAGLAVVQDPVKPDDFDGIVAKQMKKLKSVCKGDFASTAATSTRTVLGLKYAAYDAACIAGANSTSAAVLFYQKNGALNVISMEAAPDDMGRAMDARDRMIGVVGGE